MITFDSTRSLQAIKHYEQMAYEYRVAGMPEVALRVRGFAAKERAHVRDMTDRIASFEAKAIKFLRISNTILLISCVVGLSFVILY